MKRLTPVCLAFALAFSLCGNAASLAQSAFPEGITIIAGFAPGGGDEAGSAGRSAASRLQPQPGYDQTARLYARHLGAFLPGKPAIAIRHMPGAGSLKAAQFLAHEAKRDGGILGVVSAQALLAPLLGEQNAGFFLSDFAFIGGRSADEYLCAADGSAGLENIEDLKTRETAFGVTAPGRRPSIHANLLQRLTGAKLRLVSGYRDNNELVLALRRGEISGVCGLTLETFRASLSPWIASGRLKPLMRLSPPGSSKLPAVPTAQEIAGQAVGAHDASFAAALDFMALEGAIAWTLTAPAATPPATLANLREAFSHMQRDPAYLREAARRNLAIEPVSHKTIEAAVVTLQAAPEQIRRTVRNFQSVGNLMGAP